MMGGRGICLKDFLSAGKTVDEQTYVLHLYKHLLLEYYRLDTTRL